VSLVHDDDEAARVRDVEGLAASVRIARVSRWRGLGRSVAALPGGRPLTHCLLDSPDLPSAIASSISDHRPDVVLAYCSGMARVALQPPLAAFPMLLDMVDVDSAKWRDLAVTSRPPMSWIYRREARTLGAFEAEATRSAVATTVVTERERVTLAAAVPGARVEVVGNGVDVEALRAPGPPSASAEVVFCGVMNYAPNEQAASLLARDVWPRVRARRPDATLTIVGAYPTALVMALAEPSRGITVTGAVPDVRPYLWRAAVSTAPLVTARGIQNKVLEAIAAGLPTVVTPNVADALPPELGPAVIRADGAEALAAAILGLLDLSAAERRAMTERAALASLTWERQLAPLAGLVAWAGAGVRPIPSERAPR
jgi:sugar transferase (PEP-CTERM/EpsH1 system associated)